MGRRRESRVCGEGELGQGSYAQSGTAMLSHGGSLMLIREFTKEAGQQALVHSASKVATKIPDFHRSP